MKLAVVAICSVVILSGCMSTGRYSQRNDSAPDRTPHHITSEDAVPIYEEYNKANSRSYEVLGRRYHPLETGKGYVAEGEASWYGQKFHGHLTANGETYDMYEMSAAHKTLPIPSYVKVTNTENDNSVIVRVNDRGPFHGHRLIDLSYAAARKLDMLKTGTAHVKLEVVHVDEEGLITVGNQPILSPAITEKEQAVFIQVAALQDQEKIDALAKGLTTLYQVPTHVPAENGIYRLRLGPLENDHEANKLLTELKANGYDSAYKLYVAAE
ncbi:septal ring lytic transglycosylase RlpA family protein [Paraneptunicella aestuarii]|uniref:septal ring lytic transglycosylase RlpA family protein n=1 Tax=Paraneptunicella aestuarii TaxID=2831148 RepID=UPI001E5C6AE8|nr:septal ring lytic transglycosylase RlpA family protein [Paraneptunicella aestuarii]UAA39936.1 septal ring lytic transglycosylase RlpA family protein [Paraneptunicella aestuarii]